MYSNDFDGKKAHAECGKYFSKKTLIKFNKTIFKMFDRDFSEEVEK